MRVMFRNNVTNYREKIAQKCRGKKKRKEMSDT